MTRELYHIVTLNWISAADFTPDLGRLLDTARSSTERGRGHHGRYERVGREGGAEKEGGRKDGSSVMAGSGNQLGFIESRFLHDLPFLKRVKEGRERVAVDPRLRLVNAFLDGDLLMQSKAL